MSYEDSYSIATPEGLEVQLTLAGVGSRFIAAVIDQAVKWSVVGAMGAGLALVATDGGDGGDGGELAFAGFLIVLFVVQFGYDVAFEVLASGRTPGKRWTGLRVVRTDGSPVGLLTSAVRNLLRLVDFLPFAYAVGTVAVLASSRNQRLGDLAAGTVVVRERRGGRRPPPTPPPSPPRSGSDGPQPDLWRWDVSAITAEEVATVRRFLERRGGLTAEARSRLAVELAGRLRPKVVGPADGLDAEGFLEALESAKRHRA